jgi:hypothetical protein
MCRREGLGQGLQVEERESEAERFKGSVVPLIDGLSQLLVEGTCLSEVLAEVGALVGRDLDFEA